MTGPRVLNRSMGAVRGLNYIAATHRRLALPAHVPLVARLFYRKQELGLLALSMIQQESAKASFPARVSRKGRRPSSTPRLQIWIRLSGTRRPATKSNHPGRLHLFGQFIDHNLTYDPNSSLQKPNDPEATENFRTPRLDLDSL
jgi:hypothetical protein